MNKAIISGIALVALLLGGSASAQVYYPTTSYGSCITLSRDLAYGSRGSDVTSLQTFLVAQNYPGGGNWMITGYYGTATQAAVRNFQQSRGLAQTGYVDSATRAAISNCSSYTTPSYTYPAGYPYNNSYNYNYNYNNNSGYNYGYNYGNTYPYNYSAPTISSLSVTSATVGSAVTIYGTGFDYSNNTVYVGSMPVANVASYNGTSLTFTVPNISSGSMLVYVTNARGSSNTLTLSVTNYGNTCGYGTTYGGSCGCQYGSTYGCPTGQLSIQSLSPNSGAVGQTVTIYGQGFSTSGNTVRFGNGIITNVNSTDGRAVSFVVPTYLTGYGNQTVNLGTYNVSVSNASGMTSNALPFTVTSLGTTNAPIIQSVTGPTTLSTNSTGVWTVNLAAQSNTYTTVSVRWGDEGTYGSYSQPQTNSTWGQQTFSFSHAYAQSGTYTVTFTASNQNGQQSISTATVTVTGSGTGTNQTLSYMSPTSGRVGTQIVLSGSGFPQYGNVVHFGTGGSRDVVSMNGNTIYYTIPSWISPCDPMAQVCTMQAIQVTPGTYPIYVSNSLGQTNTLYFTVTN